MLAHSKLFHFPFIFSLILPHFHITFSLIIPHFHFTLSKIYISFHSYTFVLSSLPYLYSAFYFYVFFLCLFFFSGLLSFFPFFTFHFIAFPLMNGYSLAQLYIAYMFPLLFCSLYFYLLTFCIFFSQIYIRPSPSTESELLIDTKNSLQKSAYLGAPFTFFFSKFISINLL